MCGVLRNVAVVVDHGVAPFEMAIFCEAFGLDRSEQALPTYDFAVVTPDPSHPVRSKTGFEVVTPYGLDRLDDADLVAIAPSQPWDRVWPAALLDAARRAHDRGAIVMSLCAGAFALAQAGLLDGRSATTHWMYSDQLARLYPLVDVRPDVLYVDADPIYTSAGTAAGIDLCLYLMRKEHGAAVANAVARRMVVSPHRDGGQAQYVEAPVPPPDRCDVLGDVLAWAVEHLHEELTVERLARRALMSERTFIRRFREVTGTTPYAWVLRQRTFLAQRLLEERPDLSIEHVAAQSGFGAAAALRHHFGRERGTSPLAYRRMFAAAGA
jgi:transcriptional regulator GlxA family with amidase domain